MNAPNLLSLVRILFTFFFILAVYHDRFDYALYLFVLQGLTDMLDGFLARVMKKKTELGAYLDPIADKTMLLAAFIMLSIKEIIPLWFPATIILKDVAIAIGFFILYRLVGHIKPVPSIFGKLSTTLQIAMVVFILLTEIFPLSNARPYAEVLIFATAFVTVIAGLHYILCLCCILRHDR
ncbi:MAG TPA: CDP-alcohol phosphatidyltransferase family protein [Syntrophorhabdaceae bacterium]|nr:CDP-alcohol phosphatidyltransferase family protein [Syntrophorhabdaceae bacterium]